jgi:hypothetical protein
LGFDSQQTKDIIVDDILIRMMNLESTRAAIYRQEEGEVTRDEFQYARVLDEVLFDEHVGFIATLGPTWNMVHDPRFVKLENSFVIERKGVLGGNANVGQSIMSEDGFVGGNPNDLEKYAEILGEGRNMLKAVQEAGLNPQTFQDNDEFIWSLLRQQSPNWFRQNGTPNKEATRLYDMCKAGLVGLIADYTEVALCDEWVDAESGELMTPEKQNDPDVMAVYMEVDQLDKAISARTQLRCLAVRVLKELGLSRHIKGEESRLTDMERDEMLRIIYQSKWPEGKPQLMVDLLSFIGNAVRKPYEEREKEQLARASEISRATVVKIKTGEIKQINRVNEKVADDYAPEDSTNELDAIMRDPLKRHLFPIYTAAEKANQTEIVELLAPIFATPGFVLDETNYWEIASKLAELSKPKTITTVEEEFHSKESPYRS